MRHINVRTDEAYNQKYLGKEDALYLHGYDDALTDILNLFDNLGVYEDDFEFEDSDMNLARFLRKPIHEKDKKALEDAISDWHDSMRDETVVAMIDGMDEEEYEKAKREVDGGGREPYFTEEDVDNDAKQ